MKYLIPVSQSKGSYNTLNYGMELFTIVDAEGYLLHVVENHDEFPSYLDSFTGTGEDREISVKQKLKEIVCRGEVVNEILAVSSQIDPDLILISSVGENRERRFFASKNTTEVILNSSYPVLMIPPDVSYSSINTIVFATDMRNNNISLVQEMLHLFRYSRCTIHMLVLSNGKSDWHYKEEVKLLVESLRNYWDYDKIFVSMLEAENILIRLEMFLKEQKADMLAFDKNNPRFQEIFFQNPDKQMPCCMDLPILALSGSR